MKYKTLVIDPPWPGPGACPTFRGNSETHVIPYNTMTGAQCASLRVPHLADAAAQLWLWSTSRSIGDAFLLLQLWGFSYRGLFVWTKRLGIGRHMRHQVEFLLWGGRPGARLVESKNCLRQLQAWPKPKRHSEKPSEAYEMILSLSEPPRIDIFARQQRPGFVPWPADYAEAA